MNANQNLFLYGIVANLVQLIGLGIIVISGSLMVIVSWGFLFGVVIGVGILIKGKAMRFDYQKQSGTIIHKGYW